MVCWLWVAIMPQQPSSEHTFPKLTKLIVIFSTSCKMMTPSSKIFYLLPFLIIFKMRQVVSLIFKPVVCFCWKWNIIFQLFRSWCCQGFLCKSACFQVVASSTSCLLPRQSSWASQGQESDGRLKKLPTVPPLKPWSLVMLYNCCITLGIFDLTLAINW